MTDPTNYWFVGLSAMFAWIWLGCFMKELNMFGTGWCADISTRSKD